MEDDDAMQEVEAMISIDTAPPPTVIQRNPSKLCIARIQGDLKELYRNPIEGIVVAPDEARVDRCHAIVVGPQDTPYESGFFYFILDFPPDYPFNPPNVALQTTGGGKVRFNPNLYACGKVCLSILGTWSGPGWSPVQTIGSVLLSIQSLMNSEPYRNEPGLENAPCDMIRTYNYFIRHETIRVAVLEMLEWAGVKSPVMPEPLAEIVTSGFADLAEFYLFMCDEYSFLNGREFQDPFGNNNCTFQFDSLRRRIEQRRELFS